MTQKGMVFSRVYCPNCHNFLIEWVMDGVMYSDIKQKFYFRCDHCGDIMEVTPITNSMPLIVKKHNPLVYLEVD